MKKNLTFSFKGGIKSENFSKSTQKGGEGEKSYSVLVRQSCCFWEFKF